MSEVILSIWKGPIRISRNSGPTLRRIAEEVASEYGLHPGAIFLLSRARRVVYPRQDFMWRCRQVLLSDGTCKFSLPRIAEFLGGMDHTTVLHGIRAHSKRAALYRMLHKNLNRVDDQECRTAHVMAAE